jgi:SAM-dependent methyltransferase
MLCGMSREEDGPAPAPEDDPGAPTSLRQAWAAQAEAWAAWARTPGHDHFFWRYNLPRFLELVPEPGALTIDVGCGEGRVGRVLQARGHRVVALDSAATLVRLAATHAEPQTAVVADAAALPLRDAVADLAVAFMSLQDVDDLDGSVREAGRVLRPGGRLCVAVLHPLSTAGDFLDDEHGSPFLVTRPYLEPVRLVEPFERGGLRMVFHSMHRPLSAYTDALRGAGLSIELVSEPVPDDDHIRDVPEMGRQRRVPWWLHIVATRR